MNDMQVFESAQFGQVRTVQRDGEPWFVATDVCRALEHSNSRMALERLEDDEKGVSSIYTHGGRQEVSIINEPGLYALVLGSRKPEARAFKRWITHDVIPAIRKTGGYIAGEETMSDDELLSRALLMAGEKLKQREARIQALKAKAAADAPKVLFANSVESSQTEILVGEMAKLLKQNGVEVGQNRFFDMLRRDGYLISRKGADRNMPTQRTMELGLMRIKETSIAHADGHVTISKTPKITGKGQVYFMNKYGNIS